MAALPNHSAPAAPPGRRPAGPPVESLEAFLRDKGLAVIDVTPGVSRGSRRLLVGEPGSSRALYAVAVAHGPRAAGALDNEEETLRGLPDRLRPELAVTVPEVVGRVAVAPEQDGLVVSGVRRLRPPGEWRNAAATRRLLAAADRWLTALWQDTAGTPAQVELGLEASTALMSRFTDSARFGPPFLAIHRCRRRVARHEVSRTLTHGCLCPDHLTAEEDVVVGVDDWGHASQAGDPLRDLGRFAVRLADRRLAEVVAGRTSYARTVRRLVAAGLERTGLPPQLWRDVLVLAQLELAVESLDRGDPSAFSLLLTAVRALPGER